MSQPSSSPQTPRFRNTLKIFSSSKNEGNAHQYSKSTFPNPVICSPTQTDKMRHIESIVYLSKPPQQGILLISTNKTHVYLKFQPYLNQNYFNPLLPPKSPTNEENENEIQFCIEDTPTYEISEGNSETQITFILGRKIPIEIQPMVFKNESFNKFCQFLKNFGVTLKDGNVNIEKKKLPIIVDINKYLNELSFENQNIVRLNWTKQNDCLEKVNKNYIWNIENENLIRKSLFYKGVEDDYRSIIWGKCLGISLEKEVFKKIKIQVKNIVSIQLKHSKILRDGFEQIQKDVRRTSINKSVLDYWNCPIDKIQECIDLLMKCWVIYDLDDGYQQGMSDVLVGIMECTTNKYELFNIFVKLMEIMSTVFKSKIPFDSIIQPIVKILDPELEGYFNMKRIGYSFMYKWIVLLFRRDFIPSKCLRLWDAMFAFPQNKFHYFIAVSMLIQHRDIILSNRLDLDDISIFFLQLENKFDEDIIIDADIAVNTFKLNASEKDQLLVFS